MRKLLLCFVGILTICGTVSVQLGPATWYGTTVRAAKRSPRRPAAVIVLLAPLEKLAMRCMNFGKKTIFTISPGVAVPGAAPFDRSSSRG